MHVHLPKPIHGWRQFFGEVGIIVLGVLIALGAEQAVEALHWHQEVREFEDGTDHELADTLAAFKYRADQDGCIQRRLVELTDFQRARQARRSVIIPAAIGRPTIFGTRTGVWMSRSPEVVNRLPTKKRLAYGSLYDIAERTNNHQNAERDIWLSIDAYAGFSELTSDQLMRLNELIYQARARAEAISYNYVAMRDQAAEQKITPEFGARKNIIGPPDPSICKPLLRLTD